MFVLDRIAEELAQVVAGLEPARLAGSDAARLTAAAARIEKLAGTAKAALAARAEETNAWRGGRAASPEQWLAETSGCSEGVAREALSTARRVETLPETRQRLLDGTLSMAQAALVSAGAAVDPGSEGRLLRTASRSGMRGLRAEKERVVAAATDQEAAARRAHRERHLRTWQQGPATHGSFSGPTAVVADLLEALEPLTQRRFDAARSAARRESHDAYRFDALLDLARSGGTATASWPRHVARVRVDLPALLRGHTEPGETCEIPGIGPVPVSHAREVLSHGLLQLVITDGVDVQTVVSTTRHVPMPLKIAITERDHTCKVRGCDCTTNLHRHHTQAFADGGLTTYRLLGNLCPRHHHLVHDDG
ncbi:MAG TPA: HNH endonuclease signature motif containing protein, partial [Acidimicrobiia bacterium]|nr:HNH endonuclease signature motif containing protein [Acidimicrobiia bacterium]